MVIEKDSREDVTCLQTAQCCELNLWFIKKQSCRINATYDKIIFRIRTVWYIKHVP
jgi:hypothetical protein